MPFASNDGVRLYWKLDGAAHLPTLVLLNSIGTDMSLWDACMPHLLADFRVLRIDTRGHGASDAPSGDYAMSELATDVVAVMDAADIDHAAVAGVSLGGMVAMQLALDHPARVDALGLVCTSAKMDRAAWNDRIAMVRAGGTAAIADLAIGRFLSPEFVSSNGAVAASIRHVLVTMSDEGYAGASAAIRDMTLADRLTGLSLPTLVVAGDRDRSTPFAGHGDQIVAAVRHAEIKYIDSAHLAPIEAPAALAAILLGFFLPQDDTACAAESLFEAGLVNRRRILGDEWVDASLANRTAFTSDFQAMITRIAWHEIWGRPGLDDQTRRFLVLSITASLGRWEEFILHVRAGLTSQAFTRDQLKEVLMQTAIYAGVPIANTAFGKAAKVIAEIDEASAR